MLIKKVVLMALVLSLVLVAQGTALAIYLGTPIGIINPSFEADVYPTSGGPWNNIPGYLSWNDSISGWTTVWAEGTLVPYLGGPAFDSVPQGINVAWSNGGTISQILSATLQPGAYTLSAWVGCRKDEQAFPGYTVALYANGNFLTSDSSLNPGLGQWKQDILHYNVSNGNPFIGDNLEIRLISDSPQVNFDDVTLNYVPIPGSVLLLGSGLAGIVFWRRKRAVL